MSTLQGIVDIHAHADPDKTFRPIDVLELAKLYSDRGVRAMIIMNHYDPTAGLAYLAQKYVPNLQVFGGIVLNRLVGGINPLPVEHFILVEGGVGRVVYMPTLDAENEIRHDNSSRPFVRISKNAELLPEVLEMLSLIADRELILSTGHSSPEEVLMLIREAKKRGVEKILAMNPIIPPISMNIDQMKEAADLGALIEFIYYSVGRPDAPVTMRQYADAIKAIGPEHCILSSCGGQAWMPIHTFAWDQLFRGMREHGLTEGEIEQMTKVNPARLLDLDSNQ